MKKMSKWSAVILTLMVVAGAAWAVSEKVDADGSAYPRWFKSGLYVGPATINNPTASTAHKVTRMLSGSKVIDFASSVSTPVGDTQTVTGVQAGDPCFVGIPTANAALAASFNCVVTAAGSVGIKFFPEDKKVGQITLSGGTGTATVTAASLCTCTDATANASVKCVVASTTLTATGTGTDVITYSCAAPVDPASGTYYVRVISSL